MALTSSRLTRAAGIAAVLSGLLYIVIQPIHPEETVATVTGSAWAIVGTMTIAMAVLGLIGLTGIYLRQVTESGLLGLLGFLLFGSFHLLAMAFSTAEVLILPTLADVAPQFVDSFMGLFTGSGSSMELGALESISLVSAVLYIAGGTVFGIALLRARVLPRWAALLLVVGALATLAVPALPHAAGRYAAVPVGAAMIWLGYSVWAIERRPVAPAGSRVRLDRAAAT